ncbi:MAG: succinate--CoA ligase subunit alpha [Actinomycetota bacterium]
MAIFLDSNSRIIVQGMTGSEGMKHTTRMLAGGSNIVGGVNPRKAGETVEIDGKSLPVFGTVAEAMAATGANVSVIFVPPAFAKAAVVEAIDAEIELAVVITEGIPVHDSASGHTRARRATRPASSALTAQASSAQSSRTPVSPRRTSPARVRSASFRSREP